MLRFLILLACIAFLPIVINAILGRRTGRKAFAHQVAVPVQLCRAVEADLATAQGSLIPDPPATLEVGICVINEAEGGFGGDMICRELGGEKISRHFCPGS